ncbi:TPA: hypothetical protein DCQ44_03575 [Candidatus Taylorbacteria bacterium]|nr:hypothetical protein [Candidatus Taylorbacteria bacterium]
MKKKGFTLIELMVTVTIMMIMTAVVLFNYNKFNENSILSAFAYDMSLTIRQAQVYGVAVRETGSGANASISTATVESLSFSSPYGVHFEINPVPPAPPFLLFADSGGVSTSYRDGDRVFNKAGEPVDTVLQSFTFQRGIKISGLCVVRYPASTCNPDLSSPIITTLDITFKRPDPEATFSVNGNDRDDTISEVQIFLSNSDRTLKKKIVVDSTGQISVQPVQVGG